MKTYMKLTGSTGRALGSCIILTVIFLALLFALPADRSSVYTANLTSTQFHMALLFTSIPSLIVWFFAFIGYAMLHQYAKAVRTTSDGSNFCKLSYGFVWLAWSLPITAIIMRLVFAVEHVHTPLTSIARIVSFYITVIMTLVAFVLISQAARAIAGSKTTPKNTAGTYALVTALTLLGILYCFMVFKSFHISSLTSADNPYGIPAWIMAVTIVAPYLYAWFIGLLAAYEIVLYSRRVSGLLYRRALSHFAQGLTVVILSFIISQYFLSVWHIPGSDIFSPKLAAILLLRLIGGLGFLQLAFGAYKLKRIEEV